MLLEWIERRLQQLRGEQRQVQEAYHRITGAIMVLEEALAQAQREMEPVAPPEE